VAHNLIQEVAVEVPQVQTVEVLTQVPSGMAEQRIVQTGIEFERMVRREEVVMGVGQAQYTGLYQAPVVQIDAPKPVPSGVIGTVSTVPMASMCVTGVDLNRDGIPDVLQGGGVQLSGGIATGVIGQTNYVGEPLAQMGVDVNRDGRADYTVVGTDWNRNGIPDAMEGRQGVQYCGGSVVGAGAVVGGYSTVVGTQVISSPPLPPVATVGPQGYVVSGGAGSVPLAAANVDVNRDGIADYTYVGVDRNRDGIPYALQQGGYAVVGSGVCTTPMASACVTGVDMNRDGIPDVLQQRYM